MTRPGGERTPTGPAGFVGFVGTVMAVPVLLFTGIVPDVVAWVVIAVAAVGALVLVFRDEPAARGMGAGMLAGFAVAALVVGVCGALLTMTEY